MGVWCLSDCRVGARRGAGLRTGNRCWFVLLFVTARTLPGILFCVVPKCVHLVNLRTHLVVGLGAAMIGGASVIHRIALEGVALCTLCSTICSMGEITGTLCRSPGGDIHSYIGHLSVHLEVGLVSAKFDLMLSRTRDCFPAGISCNVVTSSSETSCKCLFHMTVLGKELRGARDMVCPGLGHKIVITLIVVQGRTCVPRVNATAGPGAMRFCCFEDNCLTSQRSKGETIPVIRAINGLICQHWRVDAGQAEHV